MAAMVYPAKQLRNQTVVRLYDRDGLSFGKIGEILGIKAPTVWEIYHRTKGTLKTKCNSQAPATVEDIHNAA